MGEVNSFEFSLPECVIKHIQNMDSGGGNCLLAWEGEILHGKETSGRSSGRRRHKHKQPDTASGFLNNKVQILAEKKQDGMLRLTIDKLNLKIVEKKFCCLISSAKLTCAGDVGDLMVSKAIESHAEAETIDPDPGASGDDASELARPVVERCEDEAKQISRKTSMTPEIPDGDGSCWTESRIDDQVMAHEASQAITSMEDSQVSDSPSMVGESSYGLDSALSSETNKQQTEIVVVEKRKRGRPRKNKSDTPTDSTSTKKENLPVIPISLTSENKAATKGGYCLRGAKLRKDLMAAEKDESIADSDEDENGNEPSASFHTLPVAGDGGSECVVYDHCEDGDLEHDVGNSFNAGKNFDESYEPRTETRREQKSTSRKNCDHDNDLGDIPKSKRRPRNNVKVAKCRYCGKMFCDFTGVSDHVKKFHSGEAELRGYMEELQQLQVVTCKVCDMEFKSRYHLHSHENRVHGVLSGANSTACSICQKSFKSLLSLRNHVKYVHHHKEKEHLCHLCPAKFKWSNTLKQHVEEIHVGSTAFSCDACGKGFSRRAQLNRHVRIHGADNSKRIYCPVCAKSFWFEANMQRHIRAIHNPQVESFHCSYCGKGFCQRGSMLAHVQLTHFHLFPFSCRLCTAGFSRSKLLENHMRSTHGEKNFKLSDQRRQRFKYNKSPDDLFYCSYCSSSFFYKAKMIEHMHKTHSNDFPFICETCDQGFLLKKFLSTHKYAAHGEPRHESDCEADEGGGPPNKHSASSDNEDATTAAVMGLDQRESNENEQMETSEFEQDLEISNTEAAASLLVEVASGNVTTHYIIQSKDQSEYQDTNPAVIAHDIASLFLAAESSMQALSTDQDHMTEIVTTEEHGSTQVLVPSHLGEGRFEVVETFTETSIPHHSEDVTIELEHLNAPVATSGPELQIEDAINENVVANIVVASEPDSAC